MPRQVGAVRAGAPVLTVCSYAGANPGSRAIARSKASSAGAGDTSQRRIEVKSRFTEVKPHLGVSGVAADGLLRDRKITDI